MATELRAACLVLFVTLLTASAQVLWKKGAETLSFSLLDILKNYYFMGGLLLYLIGLVLIIISFRGGEVSALYPLLAASYIWVSLFSIYFLGETINFFKWAGIAAIIVGVALIGIGSRYPVSGDA